VNYSRADRIIVTMKTGEDNGVERVDLQGHVDGIQLDPDKRPAASDTTQARPPARRGSR
jgi:hypothetical protein